MTDVLHVRRHAVLDWRDPVLGLLRATRPEQWVKNLAVFVAPASAGLLLAPAVVARTIVAALAFTLAAAAIYLVNDVADRHADRRHPRKRWRPIASGRVAPILAARAGTALTAGALLVPILSGNASLAGCVAAYVAISVAYSSGAKDIPYVELAGLASLYLLRALGGAIASGVALSPVLGVVVCATALLLGVAKRHAELRQLGAGAGSRRVLQAYSAGRLDQIRSVAAVVVVVGYALWVTGGSDVGGPWLPVSVAPVAIGIARYHWLADSGAGERPHRLVWADRPLLASIVTTAVFLGLAAPPG